MNQVHITLPRDEVYQIIVAMSKRVESVRKHVETTDYAKLYGQEMGEKIKHDDEQFAVDLQRTIARVVDVL